MILQIVCFSNTINERAQASTLNRTNAIEGCVFSKKKFYRSFALVWCSFVDSFVIQLGRFVFFGLYHHHLFLLFIPVNFALLISPHVFIPMCCNSAQLTITIELFAFSIYRISCYALNQFDFVSRFRRKQKSFYLL